MNRTETGRYNGSRKELDEDEVGTSNLEAAGDRSEDALEERRYRDIKLFKIP